MMRKKLELEAETAAEEELEAAGLPLLLLEEVTGRCAGARGGWICWVMRS